MTDATEPPTVPGGCTPDNREPNDDFSVSTSGGLFATGLTVSADDTDVYAVSVPNNSVVGAEATMIQGGTLTLELYDTPLGSPALVESDSSFVSYDNFSNTQTVYIKVNTQDDCVRYALEIDVSAL